MVPKQDEDIKREENYKTISLVNSDANILNKILVNQIQQYITKIIYHDQMGLLQECKDGSFANQCDIPY